MKKQLIFVITLFVIIAIIAVTLGACEKVDVDIETINEAEAFCRQNEHENENQNENEHDKDNEHDKETQKETQKENQVEIQSKSEELSRPSSLI